MTGTVSYVGNFAVDYSTETHIAIAFENIGWNVNRIPEQGLDWTRLTSMLEGSDLFLWTRTAGFDPPDKQTQADALAQISVPKVGYHLDRWWGLDRETWVDESPFFTSTDFLCTADGGHQERWESKGITHYWYPPAILSNEAVVGNFTPRFACDVAFVGNMIDYGHAEWAPYRRELYRFLKPKYHFRVFPSRGRPQIRGKELADLYASVKVVIGDSCLVGKATHYWSDRIPETLGRNGYLIHPDVEGLNYPYLETYPLGDFDRLGELIDQALSDPVAREATAEMNRLHVLDHDTYEHRLTDLVSRL